MIEKITLYVFAFFLFVILQALAINGWHECFRFNCVQDINKGQVCNGNIFFKLFGKFIKKYNGKSWIMPIWGCVKCESSVIGSITFWVTIIPLFGFNFYELWVWIFDMFVLVSLNWLIYKKI